MPEKMSPSPAARTTVRLPEEIHRRAKLAAAWYGRKIQDFVAEAVELHLAVAEREMHESSGAGNLKAPRPKP